MESWESTRDNTMSLPKGKNATLRHIFNNPRNHRKRNRLFHKALGHWQVHSSLVRKDTRTVKRKVLSGGARPMHATVDRHSHSCWEAGCCDPLFSLTTSSPHHTEATEVYKIVPFVFSD